MNKIEELTMAAGVPSIIGPFAMRKRAPARTLTGIADNLYRSVSQIFSKKKKKKKKSISIV